MSDSTKILKLNEIASWWLHKSMKEDIPDVRAALPPIQRGFVWRTSQIELLWDSIAQGFPIGSLLLSDDKNNDNDKNNAGEGSEGAIPDATHLILDGQQRATAIALGFRDIWSGHVISKDIPVEALWVDLVELDKGDRRFSFRVVTKAHPWGYRRSDPTKRLHASMAKNALEAFRKISSDEVVEPHKLDRREVFPWDAEAPVPLALLIKSIRESDSIKCKNNTGFYKGVVDVLHDHLKENNVYKKLISVNYADSKALKEANEKFKKVEDILKEGKNDFDGINSSGLKALVFGLRYALNNTEVPAPVLTIFNKDSTGVKNDEDNPLFNLFKRINNGGTPLTREEINYSLLKSAWPGAKKAIEDKLLKSRKIAQPARMASIITRLYLMKIDDESNKKIKAELSISQFRSFIKSNQHEFKSFCEGDGRLIVEEAWDLLTNKNRHSEKETDNSYGLPIVLAARFSQQADDLLLLMMYWLHKVIEKKISHEISYEISKRSVGFITAVSWFAEDLNGCVRKLMNDLSKIGDDKVELLVFFNNQRFNSILERENGLVLMKPLPTPEDFKHSVKERILEEDSGFNNFDDNLWNKKGLWDHYCGNDGKKVPKKMIDFFREKLGFSDDDGRQKIAELWWSFFCRVTNDKRFILYAQREAMNDWFKWFDPTLPDQTRDHNRPWDYDHILPYSWAHYTSKARSDISYLVRLWVNVNGNFRVWPLELNRSKGNSVVIENSVKEYDLKDRDAVCSASFIKNEESWLKLGDDNSEDAGKNFRGNKEHWKTFIKASIDRTADIYEEWYDALAIKDLME